VELEVGGRVSGSITGEQRIEDDAALAQLCGEVKSENARNGVSSKIKYLADPRRKENMP
jgi:hypothetical protein